MIIIVGGQTGVDRGAHKAAWDKGLKVEGYMPANGCDEDGPIPPGIAKDLLRCSLEGYPARTTMNVEMADGLLAIVENERMVLTPGTRQTIQLAQLSVIPVIRLDQFSSRMEIKDAARYVRDWGVTKLMVAGPRRSKWSGGEDAARQIVRELASFWWPTTR